MVFTTAISSFGGPEEDRTPEPFGCEPNALPAELRAQIGHFSIKKVSKNGFLRYSILREKSEKPDEKLEGKTGPVMKIHMDANRTLSQLSYRPISDPVTRPRELPAKMTDKIVGDVNRVPDM